jgi:hypothetical protein
MNLIVLEAGADASQRTPVFGDWQKPRRPGVYLTHFPSANRFAYWNGKQWHVQCVTWFQADSTRTEARMLSAHQSKPWQGVIRH